MTTAPKDVVRRFLDHGWDREKGRWDMQVIAECFDLDRYWSHTWEGNLADTGRVQGEFFSSFSPQREVLWDEVVAEGDLVVHAVTYRTTVTGPVLGVDAPGTPVTLTHVELWRVEDGKIVEHRGGIGEADHLYRQLTAG